MNNKQKLFESLAILAQAERALKKMPLPAGVAQGMAGSLDALDAAMRAVGADLSALVVKAERAADEAETDERKKHRRDVMLGLKPHDGRW